jgi:hypothetical protein
VFIPAPAWLRDRTLGEVQLTSASSPINDGRPDGSHDARSLLLPGALFVAALIAAAASIFIWLNQKDTRSRPQTSA